MTTSTQLQRYIRISVGVFNIVGHSEAKPHYEELQESIKDSFDEDEAPVQYRFVDDLNYDLRCDDQRYFPFFFSLFFLSFFWAGHFDGVQ